MTRHHRTHKRRHAWIIALLVLVVVGCGGDDGNVASNGGGIGGSGISFGIITGFGSVIVNGNTFNTDSAEIVVNGVPAGELDLTEGMLVRIVGEWSADGSGVANRVEYSDDIRGPVQEIVEYDPLTGAGTMTVLGQTVRFTSQTVFRGTSRDTIAAGDYVRISGWQQDDGEYFASLVRSEGDFTEGDEAKVKGFIRDLDTVARTFRIGTLNVSYDNATEIEMRNDRGELLPEDEGEFVEVEGRFEGGLLAADEIEREDGGNRFRANPGDDIEFEGPISSVDAGNRTFVVHGITVRVTNDTEFDDSLRESDLLPGLRVDVEGDWDASSVVIAKEIKPLSTDTEVEAAILQILDADNRVLDVGGVRVQVTTRTLITDDDDDNRLTFTQLQQDDYVEVDGIRREDGDVVYLEAIRIERDDDDDDDFELTARVDSVGGNNSFTILGISMNVDAGTEWESGLDGIEDLVPGMRVEVEYELRSGLFFATEVERGDDDDDDDD